MRNTFVSTLCDLAAEDDRIWLLTGDLGFNVLDCFKDHFPNRFVNAGIAEQNMTGVAGGLAIYGNVPFTYSIGNFNTLRCLEQIRNDICYHGLNVNIVSVGAGFMYGTQGYTHFALEDVAVLRVLPGLHVFSPGTVEETSFITRAMVKIDGPCYLRLGVPAKIENVDPSLEIGHAAVVREGKDALIATSGPALAAAIEAADILAAKGVACTVLNFHTLTPFDEETFREYASCAKCVVSVEEHGPGGLCSLASEALVGLDGIRFKAIHSIYGRLDRVACRTALCNRYGICSDRIVEYITNCL